MPYDLAGTPLGILSKGFKRVGALCDLNTEKKCLVWCVTSIRYPVSGPAHTLLQMIFMVMRLKLRDGKCPKY